MSLSRSALPFLLGRDWWDLWDYPTSLVDQHFGSGLPFDEPFPHLPIYHQRFRQSQGRRGLSEVKNDPDKFQVKLDVSHFNPDELSLKTVDNCIVIKGKHEERADEHGFVSREFTRRYMLPNEVEPETVTSSLSQEGILIIQAPKKPLEPPPANERVVPIVMAPKGQVQGAGDGEKLSEEQ